MFLKFDGPDEEHYSLEQEENPIRYSSDGHLSIEIHDDQHF